MFRILRLVKMKKIFALFFKRNPIEIYTDGSSKNGWGSWAFVLLKNGKMTSESSGRVRRGSSNQMEFCAAIEALSSLDSKSQVLMHTDSRILIDAATKMKWPLAMSQEKQRLTELMDFHSVKWKWIRAHSGNKYNERCDELCILARANPIPISLF